MSFGRILREEKGQSAVLSAMLCMVLVMVIAMTTNVGKLVTERIAMQNAVDLASYAGAGTQAAYLNEMRKVNQEIWDILFRARTYVIPSQAPVDPKFHDLLADGYQCSVKAAAPGGLKGIPAETQIDLWKGEVLQLGTRVDLLNNRGNAEAKIAAMQTADENYPGTGAVSKFKQFSPSGPLMRITTMDVHVSYKGWCIQAPSGTPVLATFVTQHKLKSWKFKSGSGETAYVAGIEDASPNSPFLDWGGHFKSTRCANGGTVRNGRCGLSTYAAAVPYYGKLGSRRNGAANWERDDQINDEPLIPDPVSKTIDGVDLLNAHRIRNGQHYDDYRVRFVGLFDTDHGYKDSGAMFFTRVPNGAKMRH